MLGHFDVQLKHAGGLDDAAILAAIRRGEIGKVLADMPTEQHARARNLVFDNFAGYTFFHVFFGPTCANPFNVNPGGNAVLGSVCVTNKDDDPSYTESWNAYTGIHNITGSVNTSNAGKRFVEDGINDHQQTADPDNTGRESILYREQWLYLPSQVISNVIKSITIGFSDNGDTTGSEDRALTARVRLKDSKGRKVAISKTAKHVLLVQYDFTLVTI